MPVIEGASKRDSKGERKRDRGRETRFMRGGGVGGVGTFCSRCWTSPSSS